MHTEAAAIRRALLAAPPAWRAAVEARLSSLEASYKTSLEARIREADIARIGWKCEQETTAALRADVAQLRAELAAARGAMTYAARTLVLGASPALNPAGEMT